MSEPAKNQLSHPYGLTSGELAGDRAVELFDDGRRLFGVAVGNGRVDGGILQRRRDRG